ncbi:MAG: hypothetical protein WD716_02855 [Fimbriimonadaceae bacterium]
MKAPLVLTALVVASLAQAQDVGLLLGVGHRDGGESTVWVTKKGVATFARKVGDAYLVFGKDGITRVSTKGGTAQTGAREVHIVLPDGKEHVIKGEEGRPETNYYVSFVSPFGIGLMQTMRRAETDAHSGGGGFGGLETKTYPSVYRNLAWNDFGAAVEVGFLFEEPVKKQFHDLAAKQRQPGFGPLDAEASPTNWTIVRQDGEWVLQGRVMGPTVVRDYPVATVTDPRLGAHAQKGPGWARVRSEYPDAIDYVSSPDGRLTVIVTEDAMFVHESGGSTLGRRVQRVPVSASRVVMTQWLEGEQLRNAAAAIAKL